MIWVYLAGIATIIATFLADIWVGIDYRVAANTALVFLAAFVSVFTVMYGVGSNWRANRIGKVFLLKGVAFSVVLWQIVIAVWVDTDCPYRQHLRFVIYALGAVAYAAMVVALWREQRRDRQLLGD